MGMSLGALSPAFTSGGTFLAHGVLGTYSFVYCFVPSMFMPRPKSCFELFILHFIFNVSAEFSWSF